jgi:hypothetical protein
MVSGCSQSALPPAARISGTYSLTVVKDLLFVTSAERSELRVLDLRANPREFVRAPNPLQPLAIPVLDHPVSLARDVDYDGQGAEAVGQYVYAQGAASNQISIVGADRTTQLFELLPVDPTTNTLQRWTAPGLVSAIAARAPSAGEPRSTLYVATAEEQRGQLWEIKISAPDPTTGRITMGTLKQLLPDPADPAKASLDPVSALLVLPGQTIAVATRSPGKPLGRTFLLNTQNKQLDVLNFPTPVRMLATHPAVGDLPAGARVFGVLDEDACAGNPDCPGILAVDALSKSATTTTATLRLGMRSLDYTGSPMVTLRESTFVLVTGMNIAPNAPLAVTDGGFGGITASANYSLLGFVSTSNGRLFFFDALALTVLNTFDSPAQVTSIAYLLADGGTVASGAESYVPGPLPPDGGDGGIPVALGAALTEGVNTTYQGTIPGFRDLPYSAGGSVVAPGSPTARLISGDGGDRIQLDGGNCVSEVGLAAVIPDGGVLLPDQGFTCPGGGTFSVRAGGNLPYVVEGEASGYMGRTANNQYFAFPEPLLRYSRFYYHPPGFDGGMPPPQIEFQMGPGDRNIQRDARYRLNVDSKYLPEYISVSVVVSVDLRFPGAVVFVGTPTPGVDLNRLFVAYPPANAILEFDPTAISPNTDNLRFSSYR